MEMEISFNVIYLFSVAGIFIKVFFSISRLCGMADPHLHLRRSSFSIDTINTVDQTPRACMTVICRVINRCNPMYMYAQSCFSFWMYRRNTLLQGSACSTRIQTQSAVRKPSIHAITRHDVRLSLHFVCCSCVIWRLKNCDLVELTEYHRIWRLRPEIKFAFLVWIWTRYVVHLNKLHKSTPDNVRRPWLIINDSRKLGLDDPD